jgi:integrase
LTHLQFEALLTTAKQSANGCDFALVIMLGLRIFEATGSNVEDLGEVHGHRVLRVRGKGDKVVLVPLTPAVGRAVERAIDDRTTGPILLNSRGTRMDRHCATRRLRRLAEAAGVKVPRMHPHMLRHTFVTTMLDAGVDLRDVQERVGPALEDPCRRCAVPSERLLRLLAATGRSDLPRARVVNPPVVDVKR